jgi:hypothetical protein
VWTQWEDAATILVVTGKKLFGETPSRVTKITRSRSNRQRRVRTTW